MDIIDSTKVEETPKVVEEVLEFKFQDGKLKFFIKWENEPHEKNTWEDYENLKDIQLFQAYINNLWSTYAVDIAINKENSRKKLSNQIKDMKAKQPATCEEILKKKEFNEFMFKTLQLLWHFLMPQEDFEKLFDEFFVLNEVYTALKDMSEKFHKLSIQMQSINQFVAITFENTLDFRSPDSFKFIIKNVFSSTLSQMSSKSTGGCSCASNCKNTKDCCMNPDQSAYWVDKNQIVLRNPEDEENMIIECGTACKCNKNCLNRYTQHSVIRGFKVFKTKLTGWAAQWDHCMAKSEIIQEIHGNKTK